jgi:hypothetical protein
MTAVSFGTEDDVRSQIKQLQATCTPYELIRTFDDPNAPSVDSSIPTLFVDPPTIWAKNPLENQQGDEHPSGEYEWEAHEVTMGLHTFVTLEVWCQSEPRHTYRFQFCMVTPSGRKMAAILADTTKGEDGRLNRFPARFNLLFKVPEGFMPCAEPINVQLMGTSTMLVASALMPPDALHVYSESGCPFCKEVDP